MEQLNFLTADQVRDIAGQFGTPLYVYSEKALRETAQRVTEFPRAYGFTPRYAMKANPTASIVRVFASAGLQIDASSEYEAERAVRAGIPGRHILLTAQETPRDLESLIANGVQYTATSLDQIENFGRRFPGAQLTLRINPGMGSGGTRRTNVGGPASSFGIWHEAVGQAQELVKQFRLEVIRIHTHIGSGSDPAVWQQVARLSVKHLHQFPQAQILNLGGGFKVGRMNYEKGTDLHEAGRPIVEVFREFAEETGRKIDLEIEPGTYLVANCGSIISEVESVHTTGAEGYMFYRINAGMTELIRPAMYGSQHPLVVVPRSGGEAGPAQEVLVAGHCCESGDIFTPKIGDPEGLEPRKIGRAGRGDYLVIEGAGAYGAGFSSVNYNSFPEAAQVLIRTDGEPVLIRRRQTLEQIVANEIVLE